MAKPDLELCTPTAHDSGLCNNPYPPGRRNGLICLLLECQLLKHREHIECVLIAPMVNLGQAFRLKLGKARSVKDGSVDKPTQTVTPGSECFPLYNILPFTGTGFILSYN